MLYGHGKKQITSSSLSSLSWWWLYNIQPSLIRTKQWKNYHSTVVSSSLSSWLVLQQQSSSSQKKHTNHYYYTTSSIVPSKSNTMNPLKKNNKKYPTKQKKKKKNKFHQELQNFLSNTNDNSNKKQQITSSSTTSSNRWNDDDNNVSTMNMCLKEYEFFASCLPGLEDILEMEFQQKLQQKIQRLEKQKGGILFVVSTIQDLYHCHYYLGCVSHILLRCTSSSSPLIRARGYPELIRKVSNLSFWDHYFQFSSSNNNNNNNNNNSIIYLDIRVSTYKSKLFHTKGISNAIGIGIQNAISKLYSKKNIIQIPFQPLFG